MEIKNYNVELRSRSHYINMESRIVYSCKTANAIKKHFAGRKTNISHEILCSMIDGLKDFGQNTGWFNDEDGQVRIVYMGTN